MSSIWGRNITISLFGESHGESIGVVLDGIPSGIPLDLSEIQQFMDRRAPGKDIFSTPRKEADLVKIQSGFYQGKTTGTPLCGMIFNTDTRSKDYTDMPLRPSHADYTGTMRYRGFQDPRGSGHFSGRITAPLVFAGAVAKQILKQYDIFVGAHISSIASQNDRRFEPVHLSVEELLSPGQKNFPVLDNSVEGKMKQLIDQARMDQDSVGGLIECAVVGMPAGIGSPMFGGIENVLASIIWGIPGIRGLEFGSGFSASQMRGSQHNDPYTVENGVLSTQSNHHGGIIGGISSGMPILLQVAFKPTASIAQPQQSVNLSDLSPAVLEVRGRHDPCIVVRAVPCVEAGVAIGILDCFLEGGNPNAIRRISQGTGSN